MNMKKLILLAASFLLLISWGCSSTDSGGNSAAPDELQDQIFKAQFVGAALCINCHQDPNVFDDPEFAARSQELTGKYLNGVHVIHSDHINAGSDLSCLGCHDPIGDGPLLEQFINQADIPAEGLAAVTCENCHGSGASHWGIGSLPAVSPDYIVCGKCHNDQLPDSHLSQNPEGDNILVRYQASQHFTAGVRNEPVCSRCHTDAGARIYRFVDTRADLLNLVGPVASEGQVQCRTCHDSHAPDTLLREAIETGQVTGSAEYVTCTNCHQGDNAAVTGSDTGLLDTLIFHENQHARVITDSHYDNPDTSTMIEGYVVNRNSEKACSDCHNPHDVLNMTLPATLTLNEQWAESGHGARLRKVKRETAAVYANMVPTMSGTAEQTAAMKDAAATGLWSDYNWDDTGNLGDCQRCHTASGLKNYLTDPDNYAFDGTGNDFSHLDNWQEVGGSGQNELLYCWGCHADGIGTLRNAGNDLHLYDRNDEHFATIPDIGKSTVCLACHGGRGNTETMINSPRSALFQGHGPTRGALVFTAITHIGYEFVGQNYNFSVYFHNKIGLDNERPQFGDGPCVGCHMKGKNHTFAAAEYDNNGNITVLTNQALCDSCHVQGIMLQPLKQGQAEAVELLGSYLTNDIINYLDTDVVVNYQTVPIDAYGSFQNWKYFSEGDPCGYVHNSYYSKRLIFDSIDWMDNGILDGTIFIPPEYGNARSWMLADNNGFASRF